MYPANTPGPLMATTPISSTAQSRSYRPSPSSFTTRTFAYGSGWPTEPSRTSRHAQLIVCTLEHAGAGDRLDRLADLHGDGRTAARGVAHRAQIDAVVRRVEHRGEHRGDRSHDGGPVALDEPPVVSDHGGVAIARRRQDDQPLAATEGRQPLRQRATHMEQWQPAENGGLRLGLEHQGHAPGLAHLVLVGVAHELGQAGRATGMKVSRQLAALDLA